MGALSGQLRGVARAHWRVGLVIVVALTSAAGLMMLRESEDRAHQVAELISTLRAEVYRESAVEWRAIGEGAVTDEARAVNSEASRQIRTLAADLARDASGRWLTSTVVVARAYAGAVDEELSLLSAGRVGEAALVDEERVDPAFEEVVGLLDPARDEAVERAERYDGFVAAVSLGIIGGAILIVTVLLIGLVRSRRNEVIAAERVEILEEARCRQEEFAVIAAHELRTPLTGIVGSLEMLRRAVSDDGLRGSIDEILAVGLSQTRRLRRVCEDLEIAARPEGSELRLSISPVPVKAAADAAVRDLGGDARLRVDVAVADGVWAQADPDRLVQVIANLVRNALQASGEGSPVTVVADAYDKQVEIAVIDRGPGIETERLESIFDRFGQGSRSGGFGIGLTVVRRLVTGMGGEVAVYSTLGEGAQFVVRLPLGTPFAAEDTGGAAEGEPETNPATVAAGSP